VQAYIDGIPPGHRPLFDRIHRLILQAQPGAEVTLSYKIPAYKAGKQRPDVGRVAAVLAKRGGRTVDSPLPAQPHQELAGAAPGKSSPPAAACAGPVGSGRFGKDLVQHTAELLRQRHEPAVITGELDHPSRKISGTRLHGAEAVLCAHDPVKARMRAVSSKACGGLPETRALRGRLKVHGALSSGDLNELEVRAGRDGLVTRGVHIARLGGQVVPHLLPGGDEPLGFLTGNLERVDQYQRLSYGFPPIPCSIHGYYRHPTTCTQDISSRPCWSPG
jgi:hypothetical protein